jgi:hypothetical protein
MRGSPAEEFVCDTWKLACITERRYGGFYRVEAGKARSRTPFLVRAALAGMPSNIVARRGWRSGLQSPGTLFVAAHSVFKKVINASLSVGLKPLKP